MIYLRVMGVLIFTLSYKIFCIVIIILFFLVWQEKIKIIFDDSLCGGSNVSLILDIEKFLTKNLKLKVKHLTYEEYKKQKKIF